MSAQAWLQILVFLTALGVGIGDARDARGQVDVWIDPGHGGGDPGNPGFDGVAAHREKHVCLEVSQVLSSRLSQIGYTSLLTRNGDHDVSKEDRAAMAIGLVPNDEDQAEPGQMQVGIHMNAPLEAGNAVPFGTETFFPPYKKYSRLIDSYRVDSSFAYVVHSCLIQNTPAAFMGCNDDRGVKYATHRVTKKARVPSILVEVCFLTNQCQQTKILQGGSQGFVANGIAAGVSRVIVPGGVANASTPGKVLASPCTGAQPLPEHSFCGRDTPYPIPNLIVGTSSVTAALVEGFEGETFPPPGWTTTTAGLSAPHRWHQQSDGAFVGTGVGAALVGGESPSAIDEWLISPLIVLTPGNRGLRFGWKGNRTFAQEVNARCLVRPSTSMTWTELWNLDSEPSGTEFFYRSRIVDLAPWLGSSVQVAFRCSGANGADFSIDDIEIGDFDATGIPQNDLCANAITLPAGAFSFTGSTCYATNNMDLLSPPAACLSDSVSSGDVFYSLNALSGDTLNITIQGPWSPVVYLVDGCTNATATCLAASSTLETGDISEGRLSHVIATTGTYYVVVDGFPGECGDFALMGRLAGAVTAVGDRETSMGGLHVAASPNPTRRGSVKFVGQVESGHHGTGSLKVFDAAGRLVHRDSINPTGGRFEIVLGGNSRSGQALGNGVYLARVQFGDRSATTSFVVTD